MEVIQWRERGTGMTFSLIPGGTFQPGYEDALLDQLRVLYRRVTAERLGASEAEIARDNPELLEMPDEILVLGSDAPCELRLKPRVTVPPFLMATELVQSTLPGLDAFVDLSPLAKRQEAYPFLGGVRLPWPQVEPVMQSYGWSLPTSEEFEWALRGGVRSLFYWGDEPPLFLEDGFGTVYSEDELQKSWDAVMSSSFAPDRERSWPWCNRFGLAAMVAQSTWCAPSRVPGDPYPLIVRGGAASSWPWQACGEWVSLLNAVECRLPLGPCYAESASVRSIIRNALGPSYADGASVRPVIRIALDALS